MEPEHLAPTTLVADVLALSPLAGHVLIHMRLDCPGCAMVRFCTLEDLGTHYNLDANKLIKLLNERLVQNASY